MPKIKISDFIFYVRLDKFDICEGLYNILYFYSTREISRLKQTCVIRLARVAITAICELYIAYV